jgi:hypothetical protein
MFDQRVYDGPTASYEPKLGEELFRAVIDCGSADRPAATGLTTLTTPVSDHASLRRPSPRASVALLGCGGRGRRVVVG